MPQWVRGCAEPIKVLYDCGMGRDFEEAELAEETAALPEHGDFNGNVPEWRVVRGQNRWKSAEQCGHHPVPGTHPVIVTTEREWGGWRVPGAEYDLDPFRIELQARIIARAPILMALLKRLVEFADHEPENLSHGILELAQLSQRVLDELTNSNEGTVMATNSDSIPAADAADPASNGSSPSPEEIAAEIDAGAPAPDAAFPGNGAAPPAGA